MTPVWRDIPITEGPDGLFHAKVTVGRKPDGRLDRRHRSGKTAKDVQAKLRDLLREVEAGRAPKVGRVPTVEEWFTTWLTDIAPFGQRGLAPRSLDDYWSRCRNWVFPQLGGIRLDALQPEHLDHLYSVMYRKKPKPCSEGHVLKTHAVIRRGLEIAHRRGRVARNVAKMIDPPGAPTVARESLEQDEVRRILAEVGGRRNAARWFVGLTVGPRQGECLGLRWSDVDLVAGTVSIGWQLQRLKWRHGCADPHACGARLHHFKACPKSCTAHRSRGRGCPKPCPKDCDGHASSCPEKVDGGLVFSRPKGWRRRPRPRVVVLPDGVVGLLRAHRAAQNAERLEAGTWWADHDLVFCQNDGEPVDPRRDWGEWKDILVAAGVADARLHVMRHTTATVLLELGEDLSIIQEVLGHADMRTTRGYQNVGVELTRRAANRMDGAFFPGATVTDLVTAPSQRRRSG
jgi:integrase